MNATLSPRQKPLFGQHLVLSGRVSEAALLKALIDQSERLPTLPMVLAELQTVPTTQLLQGMAHQARYGMDLRRALESLGLWPDGLDAEIQTHLKGKVAPIGEILVEHGALNVADLASALDEYIAGQIEESGDTRPTAHGTSPSLTPLIREFVRYFDEALHAKVKQLWDAHERPKVAAIMDRLSFLASMADCPLSAGVLSTAAAAAASPAGDMDSVNNGLAKAWQLRCALAQGQYEGQKTA